MGIAHRIKKTEIAIECPASILKVTFLSDDSSVPTMNILLFERATDSHRWAQMRFKYKEITDIILKSFYEVYNEPGDGFPESVYKMPYY